MSDGAVWRTSEARQSFVPPRDGEEVRIRKATLGSYLLDVGSQASIRVQRLS